MASDRWARRGLAALIAGPVLAGGLSPPPVLAEEPWWIPAGLQGQEVTEVAAGASGVVVRTSAGALSSDLAHPGWRPDAGADGLLSRNACVRKRTCRALRRDGGAWSITGGRVVGTGPAGPPVPLAGSPDLAAGATLIAAPAALPESLVVVDGSGIVLRRAKDGTWGRSLVLLPAGITGGVPAVTSITAFDQPVSPAVYVATDGYSVLISNDGGDSWIRAGAELPDRVFAVAADSGTRSVYAGTSNGLWVHHVRQLPGAPSYASDRLWWRWGGVVAIAALACAVALVGMVRALGPVRPTG